MVDKRDFTDRFLRWIKPSPPGKRRIVWDAQIPGFGLRVTDGSRPDNIGSFVLVTRFPRSPHPAPRRIGDYPSMTLAAARTIAREWREDIAKGVDPKEKAAEKRRADARRRADTFAAVFEAYAKDRLSDLRTGRVVLGVVKKHVFPRWADRPISDIKRADVTELVRALRMQMPIGANRVLAYLKTFFIWAIDQDIVEASPATGVKRPSKENKRERVLTEAEIRAIWQAAGELGAFGRAFKFMLTTAQRRSEVGDLSRHEVDRKQALWTLPRGRAKSDRAHEIPLSGLAVSILDECPKMGAFAFTTGVRPATTGQNADPVAIAGWSKAKAALDRLALERLREATEPGDEAPAVFPDWHLHDLRRTAATHMAKLGIDRVVIAKILNHAETEVTAVYDRHRYDAEKRRALELWAQRLEAIVEGSPGENVVPFASSRA